MIANSSAIGLFTANEDYNSCASSDEDRPGRGKLTVALRQVIGSSSAE